MKPFALVVPMALLVLGAVVHGSATHRWAASSPDPRRADRVHDYVVECGDFRSEVIPNEIPLKERSVGTTRQYFSPTRNQIVLVSVISGPPGAVSTHTPDVCYPSSGYKTVKGVKRERIDLPSGGSAGYYVAEFEKATSTRTERQRVRWAWSSEGPFDVPENARFAYLRVPELFKVYIVTPVGPDDPSSDAEAIRQFTAAAFSQYGGLLRRDP